MNNFNYLEDNPGLVASSVAAVSIIKSTWYWGILTARYIVSREPCENVVTPNDSRTKMVAERSEEFLCACTNVQSAERNSLDKDECSVCSSVRGTVVY